jgi:polyhydroxybutyrate depolymerase
MISLIVGLLLFALMGAVLIVAWQNGLFESRRLERVVAVDGLLRRYVLWRPVGYRDAPAPLPLILAFHPATATPEGFEEMSHLHLGAGSHFLVAYPEGYHGTWNLEVCCGDAARDNVNDLGFVQAMVEDIATIATLDERRIYAAGFSNGAMFCYYLACRMAEIIAAVATYGGGMQQPIGKHIPTRPVPLFHIHGLADLWSPFAGGRSIWPGIAIQPPVETGLAFWRRLAGAWREARQTLADSGAELVTYSADGTVWVQLLTIPGLGHHWPGSGPEGVRASRAAIWGPLGPAMDVNEAIFDFFRSHPLPEPKARPLRVEQDHSGRQTEARP